MLRVLILIILVIDKFTLANRVFHPQIKGATCGEKRIVGGESIDIKDVPHQISLGYYIKNKYEHFCGASIITKKFALTAAHCERIVFGNAYIRAGGSKYSEYVQEIKIKKFIVHKAYNGTFYDYDIALVKPKKRFKFGPTIQPIKLMDWDNRPECGTVYATGWGRTSEEGPGSETLQYVELELHPRLECEKFFGQHKIPFTNRMICALKERKDTCHGDTGGPLVYKRDHRLVGIVSWGMGCARPNHPGVFTQVARFRKWIKKRCKV